MKERAIDVLRVCAWLHLVVWICAALATWPSNVPSSRLLWALIYGVAGVAGWALFLVICAIAESLLEIRSRMAPARE